MLPPQSSYLPAAVSGMLTTSCLTPRLPMPPRRVSLGVRPLVSTTGSSGGRKHATALSGWKVMAKTSCSSTWAGQVLCWKKKEKDQQLGMRPNATMDQNRISGPSIRRVPEWFLWNDSRPLDKNTQLIKYSGEDKNWTELEDSMAKICSCPFMGHDFPSGHSKNQTGFKSNSWEPSCKVLCLSDHLLGHAIAAHDQTPGWQIDRHDCCGFTLRWDHDAVVWSGSQGHRAINPHSAKPMFNVGHSQTTVGQINMFTVGMATWVNIVDSGETYWPVTELWALQLNWAPVCHRPLWSLPVSLLQSLFVEYSRTICLIMKKIRNPCQSSPIPPACSSSAFPPWSPLLWHRLPKGSWCPFANPGQNEQLTTMLKRNPDTALLHSLATAVTPLKLPSTYYQTCNLV